jgi:hypothetical protein
MKRTLSLPAMLVLLFAGLLTINGCFIDSFDCIDGNGIPATDTRDLNYFGEIVSNGSYEIRVLPSVERQVRVESEDNLIGFIKTFVTGNRLIVETAPNRCLNHNLPVRITVFTPFVDAFELNGSGSIEAYGLDVEELYASINGSGNIDLDASTDFFKGVVSGSGSIEISGVAETTDLRISGSGNIYAYGLDQNKCYATISGSGNMYVYPNQLLDADISGSGTIYYMGNPLVVQQISGSGRIIKQ